MPLDEDATRSPNAPSVPEQTSADDAQPQSPRTTSTFESPVAAPGTLLKELAELVLFLEGNLGGEFCPQCFCDTGNERDRHRGWLPSHEERCAIGQTIEKARAITLIARAIASTKENA